MSFKPTPVIALLAVAFALAACDRKPTDPPQPKALATERSAEAPAVPPPVADPSLPAASAALNMPAMVASGPVGTLHMEPVSKPAESAAMPLGGQNNDHSTTKPYEDKASSGTASAPR